MKKFRPNSNKILNKLAIAVVIAGTSGSIGVQLLSQSSAAPITDTPPKVVNLDNSATTDVTVVNSQPAKVKSIAISFIAFALLSVLIGALSAYKQYRLQEAQLRSSTKNADYYNRFAQR